MSGLIYNHTIALHKRYYKLYGKSLNKYALQKHITKLKRQENYSFWNTVGSQAIQDITDRIDKGYQLFFRNQKHCIRSSPPSFKKLSKYKSFTLKQAGWKLLSSNRIRIGNYEYVFHSSREVVGQIKTVTVKRNSKGEFYIYLVAKTIILDALNQETMTGKIAGFDFWVEGIFDCFRWY